MRHALLLSALLLLASAVAAQPSQRHSEVRIVVPDRQSLGHLTAIGEVDHMNIVEARAGLIVEVVLGERELERVRAAGFGVEVLVEDVVAEIELRSASCPAVMPDGTPEGFFFGSIHCFPSFDETVAALDHMRASYPAIVTEKESIGQSWEGRDIWMVRISAAENPESVPEALYTSLHHAREPGSLVSLLYFMYYLLENYGRDDEVTHLLENRALYFIPVVNPDGYVFVETDFILWRKNRRQNAGGSFGVDLNRNYAHEWNCSWQSTSCNPVSETYAGPYPFSEPETQALRAWLQGRSIRAAYNFHTHGEYWLHPFGFTTVANQAETPDHAQYATLGGEITRYNGYAYGLAGIVLYPAAGTADDWMYGEQSEKGKIFGFTPELGTSFWPPPSSIVPISHDALHPNLVLAHFVGPYLSLEASEVSEASAGNGYLDPGEEGVVQLTVHNLGLSDVDGARARVSSTDPELPLVAAPWSVPFPLLSFARVELPPLTFVLGSDAALGRHDGLVVEIEADGVVTTVELASFTVGTPVVVFEDPIDHAYNWELGDWGLTSYAYSHPYALADSPGSTYPDNADNTLKLTVPLDLSGAEAPVLRFMARWDIESDGDFVQVLASTDGATWSPLHGRHTRPGSGSGTQPAGQPGYAGHSDWWVQEEMALSAFAGEPEVFVAWRLRSDESVTAEGFYLDDVEVHRMVNGNQVAVDPRAGAVRFALDAPYPNPTGTGTHLRFTMGAPGNATVTVYDVLGRRVRVLVDDVLALGAHVTEWDTRGASGAPVAAGIYVVELRTGARRTTRQVAVIR